MDKPATIALRIALAALIGLAGMSPTRMAGQSPGGGAGAITADGLAARIAVLAHDSMGGRATPSPGLEAAARYIAASFAAMGLRPAGTSGFFQRYTIPLSRPNPESSFVSVAGGPTWHLGPGFSLLRRGFTNEPRTATAIVLWGENRLPEALATLDIAGRVVIGLNADVLRGVDAMAPAAVILAVPGIDIRWTQTIDVGRGELVDPARGSTSRPPMVLVARSAIDEVLAAHGIGPEAFRTPEGQLDVPGLEITVSVPRDTASAPNVAAILPGSDPVLRNEYVVVSAHMDHIGTAGEPFSECRATGDDRICNGADDDASGVATMMEIAAAVAALPRPPRRSFLFLAVSGEEKGLWGSDYFAGHPTVPIESIVADLNIDMVGRNWPDTIVAIGKEHSDLGETLNRVNAQHPELGMTAIDDLWPAERFYFRSDHFNFARRGVPILFFFNGVHDHYHRPGDEIQHIDAEKAARIGRLVYYLAVEIANETMRPRWIPESRAEIVEPEFR